MLYDSSMIDGAASEVPAERGGATLTPGHDSDLSSTPTLGDRPRFLDPFAFPTETRGRFRMLVVAALLVGVNIATVVVDVKYGIADQARLAKIFAQSGAIADPEHPDPRELAHHRRQWHKMMLDIYPIVLVRVLVQLSAVGLLALLAIGIYVRHPRRKRIRRHLHSLRAERAPTVAAYLRRCADNLRIPWLRIEYRPGFFLGGETYGLRGREALALNGTPEDLEREWGDTLKAVALHEIGHVVNCDAGDREMAKAFWGALVTLSVLAGGWLVVLVSRGALRVGASPKVTALLGVILLWSLVAQSFLFRLVRAGLIRSREFYADWRVVSWGFGTVLGQIILSHEGRGDLWWRRLWDSHPSARSRKEALSDPRHLFRISCDLPLVTGILFMCIWSNAYSLVLYLGAFGMSIAGMLSGDQLWATKPRSLTLEILVINDLLPFLMLSACFLAVSYLGTSVLGVQVQRAAVVDLATSHGQSWGYLRLLPSALLLSIGMEAGLLFAPISPFVNVYLKPIHLLAWFLGATLIMWLWLVYIRAGTRLSLGIHPGKTAPEFLRAGVLHSAAVLLAFLFWPLWVSRWVLTIQPTDLPAWLPSLAGGGSREAAYAYLSILPLTMAVLAVGTYVIFSGLWLFASLTKLVRRRPGCPSCGEVMSSGFTIGRFCDTCCSSLASWAYEESQGDPGGLDAIVAVPVRDLRSEARKPRAGKGCREVWVEIAALALASCGLLLFTVAGFQLVTILLSSMILGSKGVALWSGVVYGWKEASATACFFALIGVCLFAGAWMLQFLSSNDRQSAT